ncbi:hypothetical protein PAPHI01_0564 [Pancytospora philotis]|nr:hypothetical protein PAPHI01_0564 [Pancytospora philotis]
MNKELERLCNRKNYAKILAVIESKTSKPSLLYKDLKLSQVDLEHLKKYALGQAMGSLYKGTAVPPVLVSMGDLLGPEFALELKAAVTNYIVSQSLADTGQRIAAAFTDLGSLCVVYEFVEEEAERIADKHGAAPAEWDLVLKYICKVLVMVKQQICDSFFLADPEEMAYIQGLNATIAFEKRLAPFFATAKCCSTQIEFKGDDVEFEQRLLGTACVHARMLSALFVSHVDLYLDYFLRPYLGRELAQQRCEMDIVEVFLHLFRDVEQIYERLSYFEDQSVYSEMLAQIDFHLSRFVKKMRASDTIEGSIAVFSTIGYIRETLQDLIARVAEYFGANILPQVLDDMAQLEHLQSFKVEQAIAATFPPLHTRRPSFDALQRWFDARLAEMPGANEEVRGIFVEMSITRMLVLISLLKMTAPAAELLLKDVCALETHLEPVVGQIPCIATVKEYLRIFICPTADKKRFVENFNAVSSGIFSFDQILNALKDQADAAELFLQYKQTLNR